MSSIYNTNIMVTMCLPSFQDVFSSAHSQAFLKNKWVQGGDDKSSSVFKKDPSGWLVY